ncbi:MAG: tetratricopeptide repeat protein [Candidatus Kryptoniota bacterium]
MTSRTDASQKISYLQSNPPGWAFLLALFLAINILALFWKPLLALYYQEQAGRLLAQVIPVGDNDYGGFACLRPFIEDPDQRYLLKQALAYLSKAQSLAPNQAHTDYLAGRSDCLLGDYEGAVAAFQRFAELRPQNPSATLEMGFALVNACPPNGKCANLNAYDTWRKAGVSAEQFLENAERERKKENYAEALLWYQSAQRMGRELRSTIAYTRYLIFQKAGDAVNADKALQSAVEMDQGWLDEEMRFNGYYLLGKRYSDQKEWKHAEKILRRMILYFAESDTYKPKLPELYRLLGNSLTNIALQSGKTDRLEDAYQSYFTAWKLDPITGTLPLVNFLVNNKKDLPTAENILQQAIASSPDENTWLSWNNRLGDIFRSEKRWDEAISIYERIVERDPKFWAAYIGLGWAKYERGDGLAEALSEFQKAILIPESKGAGQFAIAQVLTREKQYPQADEWYKKALEINPEASWWWAARGNALRTSGELAKAIEIYLMGIQKFPNFSPLYYEIAWAYKLNQQQAEAAFYIEKAIALMEAPNLGYYLRAGLIYEEIGDKEKAMQFYKLALQMDPANEGALKGLERVKDKNN